MYIHKKVNKLSGHYYDIVFLSTYTYPKFQNLRDGNDLQAVLDGVDILTLSVGPEEPPEDKLTFLSLFEIFMLAAHKAGTLVVQAAGNEGPSPYSVISYSPWAVGVASCDTDRTYPATLILGNGLKIAGVGLSG